MLTPPESCFNNWTAEEKRVQQTIWPGFDMQCAMCLSDFGRDKDALRVSMGYGQNSVRSFKNDKCSNIFSWAGGLSSTDWILSWGIQSKVYETVTKAEDWSGCFDFVHLDWPTQDQSSLGLSFDAFYLKEDNLCTKKIQRHFNISILS